MNNISSLNSSGARLAWWQNLSAQWKAVFIANANISATPTDAELQKVLHLEKIDCSDCKLTDVQPLQYLANLREINCSKNRILDISPLLHLKHLQCFDYEHNLSYDEEELLRNASNFLCDNFPNLQELIL